MMKMCKKHNWETQLIGEHKLGTVCTKCGILKKELDKMNNEKLIDKIANHLKEDCQGSTDYLSGINDGVYKTLHYCLDRNMIPVQDVREKAKEFLLKMSKEPSMISTESMLVKFYCDLNGTAKRLTQDEVKPIVIEKFADNGEFSHYELINPKTNEVLWTENSDEIDWKLIEKELKHLIDNYGVPENDYRGYPDADDIVRTVKYIIEHKKTNDATQFFKEDSY